MRRLVLLLLSASAVLFEGRCAWAQAGRPFIPRIPAGGSHIPHIHVPHQAGGSDSDLGIVIACIVGFVLALAILFLVGHTLGWILGGGWKRLKERERYRGSPFSAGPWQQEGMAAPGNVGWTWPATGSAPAKNGRDERDLILNPFQVETKARETTLLMEFLAHQDRRLDHVSLRALVSDTFSLVQQCWEARDYGPLSDLLCPGILAEHEDLLRQMRQEREINRIEGLRVEAIDFVHLFGPEDSLDWKIAALITFEATVYFVNDRTGAHTHGSRSPGLFQEFWVFRRQGERWRLAAIERTHASNLLRAANHVAGLSAEQLENAQHSVAL
jgi:hypothetical protein